MNIITIASITLALFFAALAYAYYMRLRKIKTEYKDKVARDREQFYEIVHELRAPLTAIKDAVFLLNDMPGALAPEQQKKMFSLIKEQCKDLLEKISGVLDASKVETNKLTLQKAMNPLKNLIEEKVLMYTPMAKNSDIEITSEVDPVIGLVMYDPKLLGEVMNNLLSNSMKYVPKGGKITVSAKIEGSSIVVSVFDNGKGVDDEKQKQLFSKFASINDNKSTVQSSGLGLYVAKGIIEAHGGKVMVETKENRGYKVSFTLPFTNLPTSLLGSSPSTPPASAQPAIPNPIPVQSEQAPAPTTPAQPPAQLPTTPPPPTAPIS